MNRIRLTLFLSCLGLATFSGAQTVIYFEAPGAGQGQNQGTVGEYIGADNSIVGWYFDSYGKVFGYLRNPNGKFATFAPYGSAATYPYGINSSHTVVGRYDDPSGVMHGFSRIFSGKTTAYDAPGAGRSSGQGTVLSAINTSGEILGYYLDSNNAYHGFLIAPNGQFNEFGAPGAGTSAFQGTQPATLEGLTDTGAVAGTVVDSSSVSHGFLRAPDGTFSEFDAAAEASDTFVSGINSNQTIVGSYTQPGRASAGFLRTVDGQITPFGFWSPAVGTISATGAVVGWHYSALFVGTGFFRTPKGGITFFDIPDAGSGPYQGTFPSAINDSNEFTGYFVDSNGVFHGFIVE